MWCWGMRVGGWVCWGVGREREDGWGHGMWMGVGWVVDRRRGGMDWGVTVPKKPNTMCCVRDGWAGVVFGMRVLGKRMSGAIGEGL